MSEKWKFYLPLFIGIFLATVPGVVLIKSDLAVVKNDIASVKDELPSYERKDVAAGQHQVLRLELKVLEQKVDQLRVEFQEFCRTVRVHVDSATHAPPK